MLGVRIYKIVTGVTSDVGVPSTHLFIQVLIQMLVYQKKHRRGRRTLSTVICNTYDTCTYISYPNVTFVCFSRTTFVDISDNHHREVFSTKAKLAVHSPLPEKWIPKSSFLIISRTHISNENACSYILCRYLLFTLWKYIEKIGYHNLVRRVKYLFAEENTHSTFGKMRCTIDVETQMSLYFL